MDTPKLKIKGKAYEPAPPTMRVWRLTADFDEQNKVDWEVKRLIDEYSVYIVEAFNRKEVTRESIEESLLASELIPFGNKLKEWVLVQVFESLVKIPKDEAPKANG